VNPAESAYWFPSLIAFIIGLNVVGWATAQLNLTDEENGQGAATGRDRS
jgi:hypothetical protein